MPTPDRHEFGPFRLDLAAEQLLEGETVRPLQPRAFSLLRYLVEHPGRVVTKEELFEQVWDGAVVTESALSYAVAQVRKALSDSGRNPLYLETVHRRGYRFRAPELASAGAPSEGTENEEDSRGVALEPAQVRVPTPAQSLVGRVAELERLGALYEQAARGQRQIVFVTGEPGIGKSTLVRAFVRGLDAQNTARIAVGQCVEQYGAGEAYLPVLDALSGLGREHGPELASLLQTYAPSWLRELPALASLAPAAGNPAPTGATSSWVNAPRMLGELAEALRALTEERPFVFVLEDLHWSDRSTLELIDVLARRFDTSPLLVIATYRPEDVATTSHPLRQLVHELGIHGLCVELALQPLSPNHIGELIFSRSLAVPGAASLAQRVHERTEGNPLFVTMLIDHLESFARSRSGEESTSPSELEEVLAEALPHRLRQFVEVRLRRLAEEDQALLEVASVAGARFSSFEVATAAAAETAYVEIRFEQLAREHQFVVEDGLTEWPDGTVCGGYAFNHALYRQSLYERLSEGRRVHLHRAIADRLEAGFEGASHRIAAALAGHYERARALEQAVRYHLIALQVDHMRDLRREARQRLLGALSLLHPEEPAPARALHDLDLRIGSRQVDLEEAAKTEGFAAAFLRVLQINEECTAQRDWDPKRPVSTLSVLWTHLVGASEFGLCRVLGERLLASALELGDEQQIRQGHLLVGDSLMWLGELAGARRHLEQAGSPTAPEDAEDRLVSGISRVSLSVVLWLLGKPEQALLRTREGLDQTASSLPQALLYACGLGSWVHLGCGDPEGSRALAAREVEVAEGVRLSHWALSGRVNELIAEVAIAWPSDGEERLDSLFSEYEQDVVTYARTTALLGELFARSGQVPRALELLDRAITKHEGSTERAFLAELLRVKADSLLAGAGETAAAEETRAQAEACYREALAVARQQGALALELRAAAGIGKLHLGGEGAAAAARDLRDAYDRYTEGFDTPELQSARELLGALER